MLKVRLRMHLPEEKKHSVQFHMKEMVSAERDGVALSGDEAGNLAHSLRNASFYMPKPLAAKSKNIEVEVTEID